MPGTFIMFPLAFIIASAVGYWAIFINTRPKGKRKTWQLIIDIIVLGAFGLIIIYLLMSWLILSLLG